MSHLIRGVLSRSYSSGVRIPPSMMGTLMDVGSRRIFNQESDMFRESVRRFMKEKLVPAYDTGFGGTGIPTKEIWKEFGDMGLLGVGISSEKGGFDGSFTDASIIHEEQIYCNCTAPAVLIHSGIVMPYIANYGTKEQIERYMPPMVAGELIGALGMTEPGAGSDLQGIRTSAKADGDDFILNGSKVFITNGIVADLCIVVAVTDPNARSKAHGLSLFLVPSDAPGYSKGCNLKKIGCHNQDTAELFFEDVRLPKSALLGKFNGGFYHLMEELPQERLGIAVIAAAHAEWMYEETKDYINQRQAFGKSLSHLPTVRFKMAELKTKIAVMRAFVDECLIMHEHKKCNQEMASMAKYAATDLENEVATECVQLHGGWGYMYETPIARAFIDSRVQPIYGGSNEIMKELISRSVIKR
uniref:Long-chain specific acyl-CoA dehydrogenase, mitochondrial n=1 Tax=Lepeophtheirus salmonis TaxID=72036 RepID=C1BSI8_LEPSM|nr:Long-chain specific acyl-CoA dehydrogenase, mitochondrial precursor [Lepeophtheirus salmonis]